MQKTGCTISLSFYRGLLNKINQLHPPRTKTASNTRATKIIRLNAVSSERTNDFWAFLYRSCLSCFDPRNYILKVVRVPMKHPALIRYLVEQTVIIRETDEINVKQYVLNSQPLLTRSITSHY